jgi:hypothetical protein
MLAVAAALIGIVVGAIAYSTIFADRPHGRRLVYAVATGLMTPVVLFVLVALLVGFSFR